MQRKGKLSTNFVIISKDKQINVAKQNEIALQEIVLLYWLLSMATLFNGYSF